jgi:GntR family transcriptional regulator of arabinose operon
MEFLRGRSKYLQVYDSLLGLLRENESSEEKYLPSERELGIIYGVDRLTIRKALQKLVEEGLVRKEPGKGTVILAKRAKNPEDTPSRSIAFILPRGTHAVDRITEPFNANLFYQIEKELKVKGYHLIYATTGNDEELPPSILESGVQGFILVSQIPDKALQEVESLKIPTVLINRISDRFPMVLEDRYNGLHSALEYLFSLGHRRIFFINGVAGHYTTETCRKSYFDFMGRKVSEEGEAQMFTSYWNFESGKAVMEKLLHQVTPLPTAICACNDMVALGAMRAAKEAGLSVPKEMSFIGFDDTEQCTQVSPTLTTVSVNIPILTRMAVDLLFSFIEKGNPGPLRVVVPTSLVVRESTGPAGR